MEYSLVPHKVFWKFKIVQRSYEKPEWHILHMYSLHKIEPSRPSFYPLHKVLWNLVFHSNIALICFDKFCCKQLAIWHWLNTFYVSVAIFIIFLSNCFKCRSFSNNFPQHESFSLMCFYCWFLHKETYMYLFSFGLVFEYRTILLLIYTYIC